MNADNKAYLKVIQYIRQQLVCEQLRIGNKLPTERELSEKLSLSRNSIREALRTMENMGIIESRQGSGNYLTGNIEKGLTDSLSMMVLMKQISYIEISQLRRGIEMQSLLLAMKRITNDESVHIEEILTKMECSQKNEETALDKEFHYAVVAASENELMINIMQSLSTTCEQMIDHILNQESDENKRLLMKSHRQIYESLLKKDLELGMSSVNTHYDIIDKDLEIDQKL
jgi:GntR family transcriptional repressor for pyruvate dehydrogenase complex